MPKNVFQRRIINFLPILVKKINMETKYGFTLFSIEEFEQWIKNLNVARTILFVQEHHTYSPSYVHFNGANHLDLQKRMKNFHVNERGWNDIGQHFTTFPDGKIATGRSLENSPACISYRNSNAICIENLGNFDAGGDAMKDLQKNTIVRMTAALCKKFNVPVDVNHVVYHHWFDLGTGSRINPKSTKSCPGTAFFGGNTEAAAISGFYPLVKAAISGASSGQPLPSMIKYGMVNADTLNIRSTPNAQATKLGTASMGAILRIYEMKEGWYRISNTKQEWVNGNYVKDVFRAKVNADILNIRTGPDATFNKIGTLEKGAEVFILKEENGWSQISLEEKWVASKYLDRQ